MGCFDTVLVPCPKCGFRQEAQSKSGDCCLYVINLEDCPMNILAGVNTHAPFICDECGTRFEVDFAPYSKDLGL